MKKSNSLFRTLAILFFLTINFSLSSQADAGIDQTGCSETFILNGSDPGSGSGFWSVLSGSVSIANPSIYNTSIIANRGLNTLRWTVDDGMSITFDDVSIANATPSIASAGEDISICIDNTTLSAINPIFGTGLWTLSAGSGTINAPSLYNSGVTNLLNGISIFRWTVSNGMCTDIDEMIITNNHVNADAGADHLVCSNNTTLSAVVPLFYEATGHWLNLGASDIEIMNSLMPNTIVSKLPLGESSFRWTVLNGNCTAFDDVVITNDQVFANGTGFMTCSENAPIIANNPLLQGATGVWTVDNQTTQIIADPQSYITSISGLVPNAINQLRWTVSSNTCSASDTINIEYYVPNAIIAIPNLVHGCADTVQLIADANIGTGTGIWTESSGGLTISFDDNTSFTTVARNLPIANNTFIWTVTDRGCESSDQVIINNSKPVNINGSDKSACINTFIMNAQVPSVTGSGIWSLVSGNLLFEDPYSATTSVTAPSGTHIAQWTITDNGCSTSKIFTITNNLTTPNAGSDLVVCENRVNLSGNALKPGESGQWSIDGGIISESFSNSTINNPEITGLRQGITSFVWSITNGNCTSEDRVLVRNDRPSVDAGIDKTICEDHVTLFGNNPNPGEIGVWTIGSIGVVISSPTAYNTIATNLSQGSNLFTWTISNGICTASDNVTITRDAIDVVAGIPYTEGCADTLYLEATVPPVGTSGAWMSVAGGGTFDNSTSYTTIARNLSSYNRLRWTITKGSCSYYDEIDFLNLTPTQVITQADKSVCSGTTIITANPANSELGEIGLWTKVASFSGTIVNPTAYQTIVTNLAQGENVFQWTISNPSCSTSDIIVVTNNQVIADAGNDKVICDTISTLSANLILGTGYWQTSTPGVIIENNSLSSTKISNLLFGINNFQWVLSHNGCSDIDEVTITSNIPKNVSAGFDQDICSEETNLSASNPGPWKGLWTLTGGAGTITNVTANQTIVTGLSIGENIFKWTVTVGTCSASSQVKVNNNSIYVFAGTDHTICNVDTLVLDGTQPNVGIYGIWSVNDGTGVFDNPTIYNTTVRGISKGTNEYVWTLSDANCSSSASMYMHNNTPDSAKVASDINICTNSTSIFALPVQNGQGLWSIKSGGGTINNPSLNNTTVTDIPTGLNTYSWIVTKNGCSLAADIDVINNSTYAYIADDDISICTPTHTATIVGNALGINETGFWTKLSTGYGVITEPTNNFTTITNIANGESFYTWTIQNGVCTDSEVLKITNNYYATSANAAGPNTLCVDYSPIIGGSLPIRATGRWTSTAPNVIFDDNSLVSTIARNLPEGTSKLTWTITKDGCSSSASINLLNNAVFSNAGKDTVIVDVSSYLLNGNSPALSSGVWTCSSPIVSFNNPTLYNALASNIPDGLSTFIWTITNSCGSTSDEVLVNKINSVSIINQPVSQDIKEGASVTFSIDINGDIIGYQWRKDSENLSDSEKFKGTTTNTLTILNCSALDAGNYDCEIIGIVNTEYSSIAILSVITDIKELSRTGIRIYPNPSDGKFYIEFENPSDLKSIRITNLNGQIILSQNILSSKENIDISNFQNGTYFINIQHNNETIQTKVVIQH